MGILCDVIATLMVADVISLTLSRTNSPTPQHNIILSHPLIITQSYPSHAKFNIVQELCESRGGRPGLSVLTSLLVSVDVKLY